MAKENPQLTRKQEISWKGVQYEVPSDDEIIRMICEDRPTTPDGDEVEPDHPDSWLRLLGFN